MSVEVERKGMMFREWKADLDLRAEAYVATTRMSEMKALPPAPPTLDHPLPEIRHGDTLEVRQSDFSPGIWCVDLNGKLYQTFLSHERALKFVNDALNQ
jgi:hypothetical protein